LSKGGKALRACPSDLGSHCQISVDEDTHETMHATPMRNN